jgi:predicted esterase
VSTELGFIHRFEPGASPGAPVLLLLHGTGGDENDLLPLGPMLLPGAALLSPRGKVLENGMPRFFRRLAMGVFDEADLTARSHELADFVAAAARHYGFDSTRVTAAGFSNGANIGAAMMLLRPQAVRDAVLLRAMVPLQPAAAPNLTGHGAFLAAGRMDTMVPPENTQRLATLLGDAGADVELYWSLARHELTRSDVDAAGEWIQKRALGVGRRT